MRSLVSFSPVQMIFSVIYFNCSSLIGRICPQKYQNGETELGNSSRARLLSLGFLLIQSLQWLGFCRRNLDEQKGRTSPVLMNMQNPLWLRHVSLEYQQKKIKSTHTSYPASLTWEGIQTVGQALLNINQPPEVITFMRKCNSHVITF